MPRSKQTAIGEALAFYKILPDKMLLVVYRPLMQIEKVLNHWRGRWSQTIAVLPATNITDKVGIWKIDKNLDPHIWIQRKHPGLAMLNTEEAGKNHNNTDDDDDDDTDDDYDNSDRM